MDNELEKVEARYREQRYKTAMCIYKLQREAGMSFREARMTMVDRGESALRISQEFGMTQDALRMVYLRSQRKLRETGKTLEEFCGEDLPMFILSD
jgi:transposase-like protein